MSKRGSKNAVSFSSKSWVLKKKGSTTPGLKEKSILHIRREKQNDKIQKKMIEQFEIICSKFQENSNSDIAKYIFSNYFSKIKTPTLRLQSIQLIKTFKIYCKKYNEDFKLDVYFKKKYHSINYKREFPDVYFFNVVKTKVN
jgi:hypothetical protein